jgi:hypothetical protein
VAEAVKRVAETAADVSLLHRRATRVDPTTLVAGTTAVRAVVVATTPSRSDLRGQAAGLPT